MSLTEDEIRERWSPQKRSWPSRIFYDNWGSLRAGWILAGVVAGAFAFAGLLMVLTIGLSRPIGHTTCRNWSKQTGRPSKFVILNFFDTGTCLTLTPDGRWVKNTDVTQFVGGGK